MATTEIIFDTTDIKVGREFMWNGTGNLTFTVLDVVRDPQMAIGGVPVAPFAAVEWSDEKGKTSYINLITIVNYYRTGQII